MKKFLLLLIGVFVAVVMASPIVEANPPNWLSDSEHGKKCFRMLDIWAS